MIAILWMYYWHANEIFIKSDQLTFAAYSSSWYNFSLKLQKSICIFMFFRPIRMSAGYLNMTLEVFITVSIRALWILLSSLLLGTRARIFM